MIKFENGIFHLQTKNTSYVISILNGKLLHLYWGEKLSHTGNIEKMLSRTNLGHLSATDINFKTAHCKMKLQ